MTSQRPAGRRILACDDELKILRALKLVLRPAGFEVVTAASVEEALDVVAVTPVEAAIIDLVLPDGNGVDLCRRLREWSAMPIIVLSAIGEEQEKVRALDAGADDYVTKPFGPQELVARLQAVLRRASPEPEESVVSAAGLEVDLAAHVVRRDGEEIHLTRTEFELLRVLVRNRGRLMTHRALLTDVWGPEYADDVTVLRGQIANLRRKIEPPQGPRRHYVRTESGVGYRFDPK
ncbi:MAG: response regulator transcription factor [Phenylobacterium sp.]|nr:MAG: response regulator transcription factor [Phenylobacterium sp.]